MQIPLARVHKYVVTIPKGMIPHVYAPALESSNPQWEQKISLLLAYHEVAITTGQQHVKYHVNWM